MPDALAAACDVFRTEADTYAPAAVVLLEVNDAQTIAGLWLAACPVWDDPGPGNGWDWAWSGVNLADEAEILADTSGLPDRVVAAKLRLLVGARLIYPDGTLAEAAGRILRARVAGETVKALGRAKR